MRSRICAFLTSNSSGVIRPLSRRPARRSSVAASSSPAAEPPRRPAARPGPVREPRGPREPRAHHPRERRRDRTPPGAAAAPPAASSVPAGPLVPRRGQVGVLEHLLLVEHGLLEVDRVGDHREIRHVRPVVQLLRRGEDVERPETEDAPENALVQAGVVDLLEARVRHALVEHALRTDHAAGGDEPLLVAPVPQDEADVTGGAEQTGHGEQRDDLVDRLVDEWRLAGDEEDDDGERHDREQDPEPGPGDHGEPMLTALVDDLFATTEQVARVAHRGGALLCGRLLSGSGVRPRIDLADPLAGQVRVELGGADASMAEERLDHPEISSSLEQMGGEAVPEGVRCDPLRTPAAVPTDAPCGTPTRASADCPAG